MLATPGLSRVVVFGYTPVGQPTSSQVLAAELAIVDAAFDPPAGPAATGTS
jgi:hypothetical protein